MQSLAFWAAVTSYALSTVFFFLSFAFGKERLAQLARVLPMVGLVPHALALALRWLEVGHGPYNTRYEVLSANVFVAVSLFVAAGQFAKGLRPLGVIVMPLAFLGMGLGLGSFELRAEVPIIFRSWWLWLHIGFAKLFGASTLMSAAAATLYLAKRRRPERLKSLPSAEALDLYGQSFLLVSFLFLGVMIAAGSLWANQSWGRYWGWDPIETAALVTWLAYGVVLHFRVLHKWSGARMAYLTYVAAGFMVFTIYVVALAVPTIHNSYMVGK